MDFRRTCLTLAIVVLATVAGAVPSRALTPGTRAARPARAQSPASALSLDNQRRIDVNNLNMWVTNFGSYGYDLSTGNAGLIYPKGTGKTAIFAAGIWFGAQVGGQVRTEVAEYSQEYGPGLIKPDGTWDDRTNSNYKVYKVARFTSAEDSTHVDRSAADLAAGDQRSDPLVHHSWSEYMQGAVPYGAPYRIYRLPGAVDPADSVDVPGPDVLGDQMLWSVYNDVDPSLHTNEAGNSEPLDLQIRQTTFAFNRQGALGNTIFLQFQVIHPLIASPPAGTSFADTLKQMYVSLWMDPDLGGSTDDLIGCDPSLSLGYVYNATNNDQLYGATPPALGYNFYLGPKPFSGATTTLPMTSFNKYINGTDPASSDQTYSYMQGLDRDGNPVVDPTTGLVTTFTNPGDPVKGTGWLDNNAADKRMMLSSGPFTMAPGDTELIVGAIVVGQGNDRLSSVSGLKFFDTFAFDAFNKDFILPSPPPTPKVLAAVNHNTVTLSWDAASRLNYHEPGYIFEGYNIYQGQTVAGPWKRLQTFDEIDQIRIIYDEVFDLTTGQLIPAYPTAFGSDAGVAFNYTATQDAWRGGTLRDATEYYFAVTAYGYNPAGLPKVLETAQIPVRVTPQRPASGTNLATASAPVTHERIDTSQLASTDVVTANVQDPSAVTGHIYKVTFQPTQRPPVPVTVGPDTATVLYSWSVIDSTLNTTLYSGQLNRRGDADYRVVDGLQFVENGKYFPSLTDVSYFTATPGASIPLTGVNFGLGFFGGGADYGVNFLGSTLDPAVSPDSFTTVQVKFSHTATQKAYRYFRLQVGAGGSSPPQGRGYLSKGFFTVPFQVWDTGHNVQLDAGFVERCYTDAAGTILPLAQQPASQDSTWDPTAEGDAGREYLIIYNRPYSDTPKAELEVDGGPTSGNLPELYDVLASLTDATSVIADGDYLQFLWAVPATSNDVYVFNTTTLKRGNTALQKAGLSAIRVVPNPYYKRSDYELSQFTRVVRFINMPEQATVRIFSLSGKLVRTLHKTDPTSSELNWDLLTDNQLPVASGVYVYHVDVPGAGSTFGRLVVFMEKERLNTF